MPSRSAIEWTEVTWNPVTGCDRVSVGCDNCYALNMAKRLKSMGSPKYQRDGDPRTSGPGFGLTLHEDVLNQPKRWRNSKLVFVNSMSDLFHAKVPISYIESVLEVMRETPQHTYQVLTKRSLRLKRLDEQLEWPENCWIGVSVENDDALYRVDHLRDINASTKFLSCEPLLGSLKNIKLDRIDWVIAGGESGVGHRPIEISWVRDLRDACIAEGVPFFFKQWGGRTPKEMGRLLDGMEWSQMPQKAYRA